MRTKITGLTIQISNNANTIRLFTFYKGQSTSYDGFDIFPTLEKAIEKATELAKIWDSRFISATDGYEIKNLSTGSTEYIKVK